MPSLADSLVSSSARALTLRKRPDLSARQQRYQGRIYWVVKDPVGLRYYRFQEEEFAILNMLDGNSSLDEVKERFEAEFPPQKLTVEELGQFIGMLHKSGLIIADARGQGVQLKKRRDEQKRKELLATLSNLLAVRFKGIDPDRILNWMQPRFKWIYSPFAVTCCMLLWLSALLLVSVQFDVFRSKLPAFHQFFTAENWIYFTVALGVTKVIHEFGHGLTCKHYGGECHEMGVMFLVLTPCLYCNVSDSWMLPNKWHRAFIGAAGMYIELCIASVCTWIWWFSTPGLLNQLCLSTMFVCSVSTLIFNANPLLRYDGYYILSDLTEIPNLRQKASSILSRKLGQWCLGLEQPEDPFLPQRNQGFFVLYSVAAGIYRWVVLFSILWFLYKFLEPYGLKVISQTLTVASVAGMIVAPLWKMGKYFYVPGRIEQVKRKNILGTLAVLSAVAAFMFLVPLPYRVWCSLEIRALDAQDVVISVPGSLESLYDTQPGMQVTANQPLAKLTNLDLEFAIAELKGKRDENQAKLDTLRHQQFNGRGGESNIPSIEESLAMLEEQLADKQEDLARLNLTAPIAGTVLPPPDIPMKPSVEGQLTSWHGSPLNPRNLGALLVEGTMLCQIGDPRQLKAELVIGQDDIEFVHEGDTLDIKLEELPGRTFRTKITKIANEELKQASRQQSNKYGGELITKTDEAGIERPLTTSYQAWAPIQNEEELLVLGLRGKAKIYTEWQTLAMRTWRYLIRTFNFKL